MRLRIRYAKRGKVVWTSHRDVARIWERTLRRAGVSVAYSGGFSPRPRLSFGLALPTGFASEAEYLDVEVSGPGPDLDGLAPTLTATAPAGFETLAVRAVEPGTPSLQQAVVATTWHLVVDAGPRDVVEATLGQVVESPRLMLTRARKGHTVTDDVRPGIECLVVTGPEPDGLGLRADLATQPRGLRPSELLAACFPGRGSEVLRRGARLHQWIERGGERYEPLPVTAAAPHAVGACA